jgi:hypothetical protein
VIIESRHGSIARDESTELMIVPVLAAPKIFLQARNETPFQNWTFRQFPPNFPRIW